MADGGGGQDRLYIVIYFVQKKNLAVSEGGGLAGGGLEGFYCISKLIIVKIFLFNVYNVCRDSCNPAVNLVVHLVQMHNLSITLQCVYILSLMYISKII